MDNTEPERDKRTSDQQESQVPHSSIQAPKEVKQHQTTKEDRQPTRIPKRHGNQRTKLNIDNIQQATFSPGGHGEQENPKPKSETDNLVEQKEKNHHTRKSIEAEKSHHRQAKNNLNQLEDGKKAKLKDGRPDKMKSEPEQPKLEILDDSRKAQKELIKRNLEILEKSKLETLDRGRMEATEKSKLQTPRSKPKTQKKSQRETTDKSKVESNTETVEKNKLDTLERGKLETLQKDTLHTSGRSMSESPAKNHQETLDRSKLQTQQKSKSKASSEKRQQQKLEKSGQKTSAESIQTQKKSKVKLQVLKGKDANEVNPSIDTDKSGKTQVSVPQHGERLNEVLDNDGQQKTSGNSKDSKVNEKTNVSSKLSRRPKDSKHTKAKTQEERNTKELSLAQQDKNDASATESAEIMTKTSQNQIKEPRIQNDHDTSDEQDNTKAHKKTSKKSQKRKSEKRAVEKPSKKPQVSKKNINAKDESPKEYVVKDKMSEVENGNILPAINSTAGKDHKTDAPQVRLYVKNETVKVGRKAKKAKLLKKKDVKKVIRRKSSGGTSESDMEHSVPKIVVHKVPETSTDGNGQDDQKTEDDEGKSGDRKLSNGSLGSHLSESSTSRKSSVMSDQDMDDDPDFEAQMMEEMQNRKQGKHGKHRRRRLSTTGSSGTPGSSRRPSVNDGEDDASTSEEDEKRQILENIQIQKEIMADLRSQFWPINKKLKALKFAKNYIEKYEGKLSRSKGYQEAGAKYLKTFKRTIVNFLSFFILWEMKIKRIESYFGTVIASYFTFLRWMFWLNLLLASLCIGFIVVPEMMAGANFGTTKSKTIPPDQQESAMDLKTLFTFGGYLQYSLTFYGYYESKATIGAGYRLPLSYFLTGVATFVASFIVILKTMAGIAKQTQAAGSEMEQYQFNMLLFTGWDFMIGNAETAKNKQAEIVTMFKEYIVEEQEKAKDEKSKLLIFKRIVANIMCTLTLAASSYAVYLVVDRSVQFEKFVQNGGELSWWESNEVTIVTSLMTSLLPNAFDLFGLLEEYHPKQELQWQLARILALNLLNLYTLVFALYQKVIAKNKAIQTALEIAANLTQCQQQVQSFNATSNFTDLTSTQTSYDASAANCTSSSSLKDLDICWETEIGQEFTKLIVFDLITTLGMMLIIDFFRGLVVRFGNRCFCWDLETKFPEYGDFKLAENILHLINNQQMIWMGTFFSPLLPAMNQVKIVILMYARGWALTMCNVPPERVFKASRSNNFYYFILIAMLYLSAVAILFMVVNLRPSVGCGPFREVQRSYYVVTNYIETEWPKWVNGLLENAASPAVIIPIFMALVILIYYLRALTVSLQRANKDLIRQLEYERTEEKKKVYAMADARSAAKKEETEQINQVISMKNLLGKQGIMQNILNQRPSNKSDIFRNVIGDALSVKNVNKLPVSPK